MSTIYVYIRDFQFRDTYHFKLVVIKELRNKCTIFERKVGGGP